MAFAAAVNEEMKDLHRRRRRRDPARRAVAAGAPRPRRALRREGDQPRAAGRAGTTVVHLCFGYAAARVEQALRLFVPAAARRQHRGRRSHIEAAQPRLDLAVLRRN